MDGSERKGSEESDEGKIFSGDGFGAGRLEKESVLLTTQEEGWDE